MGIFKRKQKIRLSPRLARTIGRKTKRHNSLKRLTTITGLTAILLIIVFGVPGSNSFQSFSEASSKQGEVLGAEDKNVINYKVRQGDTLIEISERFNVYWMTIVEENQLKAPYNLKPGQILRIPVPRN